MPGTGADEDGAEFVAGTDKFICVNEEGDGTTFGISAGKGAEDAAAEDALDDWAAACAAF